MANASFSHRSSHHTIVTRLPNHWCASSCVITSATRFCTASGAVAGSSSSATSRKVTRARVLHRAGLEVGHADLVQLAEGVGQAEVVLEPRQHRRRDVLRERGQVPLLGRGPGADRDVARDRRSGSRTSGPTTSATRYDDSGGVGANVTAPPAAPVASSRTTSPFEIATASVGHAAPRAAARRALNAGSSKQGNSAARVGRLELGDGDAARAVEAAQPGAEGAPVGDAQRAPRRPAARSANASVTVSLSASAVGVGRRSRRWPTSRVGVRHLQADRVHGDRAPRGAQRAARWPARLRTGRPPGRGAGRRRSVLGLTSVGRRKFFPERHAGPQGGAGAFVP